jgi:hypothetical protein
MPWCWPPLELAVTKPTFEGGLASTGVPESTKKIAAASIKGAAAAHRQTHRLAGSRYRGIRAVVAMSGIICGSCGLVLISTAINPHHHFLRVRRTTRHNPNRLSTRHIMTFPALKPHAFQEKAVKSTIPVASGRSLQQHRRLQHESFRQTSTLTEKAPI